jgi:uncharacterized protein (TIGR02646 family)
MLLRQISGRIRYTKRHKKYLRRLKPWNGNKWDSKDKEMPFLKKHIRLLLKHFQENRCAYCGLPLEETSNSEIEHIAPKGTRPQFTFTPYNLVLACHLCNGPIKKGRKETISKLDKNYRLCEFTIVHPYFDCPDDHFEWIANGRKILISHKSPKGKKSIEIFKLDDNAHNEARARLLLYQSIQVTDAEMELMLKRTLEYRGKGYSQNPL